MFLEDRFYHITKQETDGLTGTFTLSILADCNVYEGHFPGEPVCPGVCNIQTIKECANRLIGKDLSIKSIKQCRLTAIATPTVCPEVTVKVTVTPNAEEYTVAAEISDAQQSYMLFKGTLA